MKISLPILTACLFMTTCLVANGSKDQNCCNKGFPSFINNKIPQAYVAQELDADSAVIPLVSDEPLPFNFVFKNSDFFEFDKKTGTLTLNKPGVYVASYFTFIETVNKPPATPAYFGIYATLNGKIIPTSSSYKNVGGSGVLAGNVIAFRADCGDTFNIVATFTPSSVEFVVPPGPSNVGLKGPISKVDWSPNFYEIIYCGN